MDACPSQRKCDGDVVVNADRQPEGHQPAATSNKADQLQADLAHENDEFDIVEGQDIQASTITMLGEDALRLKEVFTGQRTSRVDSCNTVNGVKDTIHLVTSSVQPGKGCLENRYEKLFTTKLVECLGNPLSRQSVTDVSPAAKEMFVAVRKHIRSNKCMLQQILCNISSKSHLFNKLVPQIFGPSLPTVVLSFKPGSKQSFADLKTSLSVACAISECTKALIVVEDMPSLSQKCFGDKEFTEEALKMIEELAIQQADHIGDPTGGTGSQLEVQITTASGRGQQEADRLRYDVDSLASTLYLNEPQFVLLLHLKACCIKKNQYVINLSSYYTTASHFGLTKNEADNLLKNLQKFCLCYRPTGRLSDFIFLDLQWLCNTFDTVLSEPRSSGSRLCSAWSHFRNEGMLGHDLLSHIQSRSPTVSGTNLPKEWLLILLEDLQLLAVFSRPIGARKYEAFTPLFRPDTVEDEHFHCNADSASEYFLPFGGYAPPPLYMTRLITVLSKQPQFSLVSCSSSTSAVFEFKQHKNILVKVSHWDGFVRVQFASTVSRKILSDKTKVEIASALNLIIPTADKIVCTAFVPDHFLNSRATGTHLYLTCSLPECPIAEKHLALCVYNDGTVVCTKSGRKISKEYLPSSQQFWCKDLPMRGVHTVADSVSSSLRPASYVSQEEVTIEETAYDVIPFLLRLYQHTLSFLNLPLASQHLSLHGILNRAQMAALDCKLQQDDEPWTLLDIDNHGRDVDFVEPHKEALDKILDAIIIAGVRGVMALELVLKKTSALDEDHQRLLEKIQEDEEYFDIKRAYFKSMVLE